MYKMGFLTVVLSQVLMQMLCFVFLFLDTGFVSTFPQFWIFIQPDHNVIIR